ncbi:hypothetical protein Y032_0157g3215 [Ancylostoma ceylanicum]|uniref:Uncharacterized protein n=1 Tax=Ancylostoma ceylanicum TaxID=53326 RepID=A0A016SZ70_9BILA|nr:hypothetical protein Y032_0157g3215 [Ancylostoma ceylanicum]
MNSHELKRRGNVAHGSEAERCEAPLWLVVHITQSSRIYAELLTVLGKSRDRSAGTLVVCCIEAASLLGRDKKENRTAVPVIAYEVWSSL